MTQIEIIRPEGLEHGVMEVNGKLITFKNGNLYGVPDYDLTDQEDRAVRDVLKAMEIERLRQC